MNRITLLTILLLQTHLVFAEDPSALFMDSRVRVTALTAFSNPITGNIAAIQREGLLLAPGTRVPFAAISKLELSLGVQPVGKRVKSKGWKGALFACGLVSASLIDTWDDWDTRSGNKALLAVLGGGAVGGTLGAVVGVVHRPERWIPVSVATLETYVPPEIRRHP
jgi:hypothetical protein